MKTGMALLLLLAGLPGAALAAAPPEQVIKVPGYADFIAVDGDGIWVTNKGRVERWTARGKRAQTRMANPCGAMAITAGSLWVADCKQRALVRIDLATARISAVIPTGVANADGELNVVAGAGSVWLASDDKGVVVRIDPASNRVTARIPVDPGTWYLAFGFDHVWAVSSTARTVQKIDPRTDSVTLRTGLGQQPGFLAAGEGAVWVQEQGDGTLARLDPVTGMVSGRVKVGDTLKYGDIDTGGGRVWLRTTADQGFVVIDPVTLMIRARVGAPSGSGALRYTPAGIWTTAHDLHSISWWGDPARIGE